jgi:O-antigen ligase
VLGFAVAQSQTNGLPILRANTVGLLLFFATALTVRNRRAALWIVGGIALSAGLVGAVAAYDHWTGVVTAEAFLTNTGQQVSRVSAGFGTSNSLGGFLVILVPFLISGALLQRRGRSLFLAALVLAVIGIWASYSRGALLGLAVIPLFFIPRRYLGWTLPALAVLALVATPGLVKERFSELSTSSADVGTRVDIWRTAVDIWEQHPLVGVGIGGFPLAYSEAHLPGKQFLPGTIFEPPPHAHNLFLQQLAETGLIGFIALIVVLVLALHTSLLVRRSRTRWVSLLGTASLASLAAFLVHNLFDVTLLEGTGVYLFAILGLTSALLVIAGSEETQRAESAPEEPAAGTPVWQF